jgi:signal transduction histidine kinase
MPLDHDQVPWFARVSPRGGAATIMIAAGTPLALVWSMWALAGEHTHRFLFVPVLGIALVSLLCGVAAGILASALSTAGLATAAFLGDSATSIASGELTRLGGVGIVSLLVAWTTGSLRSAYRIAARGRTAATRAAEQLAREKARTERAVEVRDEVLAVVSHDLRNPLAAVAVTADLLERRCDRVAPDLSRHARTIQRHVVEMNRLIGDLVDVAKIEAGRFPIKLTVSSSERIGREAVERFLPLAGAAGVALELRTGGAALPDVRCDPQRILQALSNLLGNALKVTASGGQVAVIVEGVADQVRFTVSDTGRGIEPEDLPHLFDRFRRGRSPGYEGSGLGLAIVRGIIEAHGGSVSVESAPGQGARFSFALGTAGEPAG